MRRLLNLVAVLGGPFAALAGLDLTPEGNPGSGGGPIAGKVIFRDGDVRYSANLDIDTQVRPGEGGAVFVFGNLPQATASLKQSPLTPAMPFDDQGYPEYYRAAVRLMPPSAMDVKLEAKGLDANTILAWPAFTLRFSYTVAGVAMYQSFTFINVSVRQQIIVDIGADAKGFEGALQRVSSVLRRWHVAAENEDAAGN